MKQWHAIGLAWLLACPLAAQTTPPAPSDTALQSITARGRLLAIYDAVAWRATDALFASGASQDVEGFIARPGSPGTWDVLFGRLSAAGDSLLLAATITESVAGGSRQIAFHRPAVPGSDTDRRAFLALRTASTALASAPRPHAGTYNPYVVSREDGNWWVYLLPAQTQNGVYPHGGDFRLIVNASGLSILERHQMHNTVLHLQIPADAVAGGHSVVTGHVPQDSDVFLVLTRKPQKPELIATEHFHYQIALDGTITWRHAER